MQDPSLAPTHSALSPGAALWGAAVPAGVQVESMKCSLRRMLRPEERKEIQGVAYCGVKEDTDCFKDSFKVMRSQPAVWRARAVWEVGGWGFPCVQYFDSFAIQVQEAVSVDSAGDHCYQGTEFHGK